MAYSQIQITFNEELTNGCTINLNGTLTPPGVIVSFSHLWVTLRSQAYQVTTGTPTANVGERSAMNFMDAFNLDYNATNEYVLTRNVNVLTIKSLNTRFTFTGGDASDAASSPLDVDFTTSTSASGLLSFTTAFSENASNPCDDIDITVEANVQPNQMTSPTSINPVTTNPFTFTLQRGQTITVTLYNALNNQVSQTVVLPSKIVPDNFTVNLVQSPNGATVTITNVNTVLLDLEYSLDSSTWQSSNVFSGLAVDDYTLSIRDQYGCVKTKAFSVPQNGVTDPYFYISKSNSIRFAKRITFGDSSNYRNDENSLSCEEQVKVPYRYSQAFQSADVITTQFRSNYDDNAVVVVRADGSEVSVPVVQKSQNLLQTDRRDAMKFDMGNGMTGIYFQSGNVYDYSTGAAIDTYALNGTRPIWAEAGNYVVIDNAWFLIEDVNFDEDRNVEYIAISAAYTGADTAIIAGSIFNIENYEIFEFTIDFGDYLDQEVRVRIDSTGNGFTAQTHLSELIQVAVRHERTVEIRYRNTTNNDVAYSTGIEHLIRMEVTKKSGITEDSSENTKTDDTVFLLNASLFEGDEFTFEPVTKEMMRKLEIALSHELVFIDLVGYVKSDLEHDGALDDSNLYVVKAKMLKSGRVYNSQGIGGEVYNGENIQIPGLVDYGDGYVAY